MKPTQRSPLEMDVVFRESSDPEHPLEARVDGEDWRLLLGDFPAEPMWTLLIDGAEYASFNDWPRRWVAPGDPEKRGHCDDLPPFDLSIRVRQAHMYWVARGKRGEGRIDVVDQAVQASVRGGDISFARFRRCKLDSVQLTYSIAVGAQLIDCFGRGVAMHMSTLDDGLLERCELPGIDLMLGKLRRVKIHGGDFTAAKLDRAFIDDGEVVGAHFPRALFLDANIAGATVADCDFREADFSRVEKALKKLCTFHGTRFENCDFRGANFEGRRLKDTVFEGCRFHGLVGKPVIDGSYRIVAADFSVEGDGSDVRDQAAVAALWR